MIGVIATDLFFNMKIFIEDARADSFLLGDFTKFIIVPVESVFLALMSISIAISIKRADKKDRKLFWLLFVMIFIETLSVYWDFYQILTNNNPVDYNLYLYNFGLLFMYIVIFIFVVEYITRIVKSSRYHRPSRTIPQREKALASDDKDILIYERIVEIMENDKLYTDWELNINTFSRLIQENRNDVSRDINKYSGGNFNQFVNIFRVEAMKKRLDDPSEERSILDIGFDVGFNSRASMHRIFTQLMNVSPKQYRLEAKERKK